MKENKKSGPITTRDTFKSGQNLSQLGAAAAVSVMPGGASTSKADSSKPVGVKLDKGQLKQALVGSKMASSGAAMQSAATARESLNLRKKKFEAKRALETTPYSKLDPTYQGKTAEGISPNVEQMKVIGQVEKLKIRKDAQKLSRDKFNFKVENSNADPNKAIIGQLMSKDPKTMTAKEKGIYNREIKFGNYVADRKAKLELAGKKRVRNIVGGVGSLLSSVVNNLKRGH